MTTVSRILTPAEASSITLVIAIDHVESPPVPSIVRNAGSSPSHSPVAPPLIE